MRVLLIGAGGREAALAWKCHRSPLLSRLYVWPGNPAMTAMAERVDTSFYADDRGSSSYGETVLSIVRQKRIDLVICGPEKYLAAGLTDELTAQGVAVFGPSQACTRLESAKSFAKEIMQVAGIPTASYRLAADRESALRNACELWQRQGGVVLKADGLAAGKGVFVCRTLAEIDNAIQQLFSAKFKEAVGNTLLVEELLPGRECSFFTLIGAGSATHLGFAVDFKRLYDRDLGPNTGGMGSYAPVPWLPADAVQIVEESIIDPLLQVLATRDDMHYVGCLYVGLMWSEEGPRVLEFNVRLGDPETQALVMSDPRDWLQIMAVKAGLLADSDYLLYDQNKSRQAVATVLASPDYSFTTSKHTKDAILPLTLFATDTDTTAIFGASVHKHDGTTVKTGSGRVLTAASAADSFAVSRQQVYHKIADITSLWPDVHFRRDIAAKVVEEINRPSG